MLWGYENQLKKRLAFRASPLAQRRTPALAAGRARADSVFFILQGETYCFMDDYFANVTLNKFYSTRMFWGYKNLFKKCF